MDGGLRVQLSEEGADAERLDALTGYLRGELFQLEVGDVAALRAFGITPLALMIVAVAFGRTSPTRGVERAAQG
jgi:hypothetical protein